VGDIGTNDPEQLYVALSDGVTTSVIEHPDPNAATLLGWQEWNIELTQFGGLNLSNVQKVYIGLGDRATHPDAGGKERFSLMMFVPVRPDVCLRLRNLMPTLPYLTTVSLTRRTFVLWRATGC
jgi:hypothetical protein